MKSIIEAAKKWTPNPNDKYGDDQKTLLQYLVRNCLGKDDSQSIDKILKALRSRLTHQHKKESLQHNVLVPLRHQSDFFIGTGSTGIYLIADGYDALSTIDFYTHRITSERRHLRNLKQISKRHRLFRNTSYAAANHRTSDVFFDEAGTPALGDAESQPYFIVTGIVLRNPKRSNLLEEKFSMLRKALHKPSNYEFKSSSLSKKQHTLCLKELNSLDFEFASVVFVKQKLKGEGYHFPTVFYKFACKFLVEKIFDEVGVVNLHFDRYSNPESPFETEFHNYIRSANTNWPKDKIKDITSFDSLESDSGQMADLISGAVSKTYRDKINLLPHIDSKRIEVYLFPPV